MVVGSFVTFGKEIAPDKKRCTSLNVWAEFQDSIVDIKVGLIYMFTLMKRLRNVYYQPINSGWPV